MTSHPKPFTSQSLIALIHKRHEGNAWLVLEEIGNGTGYNVKRHADALAFGLWPSHAHAIHGFEVKVSREDVKKELRDPSKADAVGNYCDYWWLVVSDLAIIDGLVVPDTWGILYPKNGVLRVDRNAPKREAKPVGRDFFAALMRNAMKHYVSRREHEEMKNGAKDELRKELKRDNEWQQQAIDLELNTLKGKVAQFTEASGIEILEAPRWDMGNVGEAVKLIVEARKTRQRTVGVRDDLNGALEIEAARIERAADSHTEHAEKLKGAARSLRANVLKVAMAPATGGEMAAEPELTRWAQHQAEQLDAGG